MADDELRPNEPPIGEGRAQYKKGCLLLHRDRFEEAAAVFRAGAVRYPEEACFRESLGISYYSLGRFEEAIGALEKGRDLGAGPVATEYYIAACYLELEDYERAEAGFRGVLGIMPTLLDAHYGLGRLLAEREEYESAASHLERARGDAHPDALLSYVYLKLGRFVDALPLCQEALATFPQHLGCNVRMASCYVGLGRFRDAQRLLKRAVKRWPDNADLHVAKGKALSGLDDDAGVQAEMEILRRLDPAKAEQLKEYIAEQRETE